MIARREATTSIDDARGRLVIVFDPERLPQADADLFDPGAYRPAAEPVASGGRGGAWYVDTAAGPAVLRHFRRGGLVARLSEDGYLWRGLDAARSVREFRLLQWMHGRGLPVPVPLAAAVRRRGLVYRADLLVGRIVGARTLAALVGEGVAPLPWVSIGRAIGRIHRAGVDHADLNAHNILIDAAGAAWVIDFDRGRRRPPGGWAEGNLLRLQRSLRRVAGDDTAVGVGFAGLREGWLSVMEER